MDHTGSIRTREIIDIVTIRKNLRIRAGTAITAAYDIRVGLVSGDRAVAESLFSRLCVRQSSPDWVGFPVEEELVEEALVEEAVGTPCRKRPIITG